MPLQPREVLPLQETWLCVCMALSAVVQWYSGTVVQWCNEQQDRQCH
jgi:hypothetical protein